MLHLARENLVVVIAVGAIAGWLVSHFVKGIGFGILGDLVVGIAGAFVGDWLTLELNIHRGSEFIAITVLTVASLLSLFAIGTLRAAIEQGASWGRHEWRWL